MKREKIVVPKLDISTKRSDEVADIIDRMPTGWARLVSIVVATIVMAMLTMGMVVKYPDTVSGSIVVTTMSAPVRVVAPTLGRLCLLAENDTKVEKGACLDFIENGANYKDVLWLEKVCESPLKPDCQLRFPARLDLGSLSAPFNDFVLSYTMFDHTRSTKVYDNMRSALLSQQATSRSVLEGLSEKINIHDEILQGTLRQYEGDSALHRIGALSDEGLARSKDKVLEDRKTKTDLRISQRLKLAELTSTSIDMGKIDIEAREELMSSYGTMLAKYNILRTEIRLWKERYLILSPITGTLEHLGFLRDGMSVAASAELFSVYPSSKTAIGELTIPSTGAGNVMAGQEVKIRLANYPYSEYGYVRGKVSHISAVAKKVETPQGMEDAYLVHVSLPDGMRTNYGRVLPLITELSGVGYVVTRKRRLLERLFDNIQSCKEK